MSFGLKIFKPDTTICIDGDFQSYKVWMTGICPANTFIDIPRIYPMPLVFVRPTAYGKKIGWNQSFDLLDYPGTDPTYVKYRMGRDEVKYVLAIPTSGGTGQQYGLRVFKPDATVSFDSGERYVNVDSIVYRTTNTRAAADTWSQTITYNSAPMGERYWLLNPIGLMEVNYGFSYVPCDGCPSIEMMEEIDLLGTFNSETSMTFNLSIGYTSSYSTGFDGIGPRMDNPQVPLISAYINL